MARRGVVAEKWLLIVVEGDVAMGQFWPTIVSNYIQKIVRYLSGNSQSSSGQDVCYTYSTHPVTWITHVGYKLDACEVGLVMYNANYTSNLDCGVQFIQWTKDVEEFLGMLPHLAFNGDAPNFLAKGLAEALLMFLRPTSGTPMREYCKAERHCILVSGSHPFPGEISMTLPIVHGAHFFARSERENHYKLDYRKVAQMFTQLAVSLSVISPNQRPVFNEIFNLGNNNPVMASVHNSSGSNQFTVLLTDRLKEARNAFKKEEAANNITCAGSEVDLFSNGDLDFSIDELMRLLDADDDDTRQPRDPEFTKDIGEAHAEGSATQQNISRGQIPTATTTRSSPKIVENFAAPSGRVVLNSNPIGFQGGSTGEQGAIGTMMAPASVLQKLNNGHGWDTQLPYRPTLYGSMSTSGGGDISSQWITAENDQPLINRFTFSSSLVGITRKTYPNPLLCIQPSSSSQLPPPCNQTISPDDATSSNYQSSTASILEALVEQNRIVNKRSLTSAFGASPTPPPPVCENVPSTGMPSRSHHLTVLIPSMPFENQNDYVITWEGIISGMVRNAPICLGKARAYSKITPHKTVITAQWPQWLHITQVMSQSIVNNSISTAQIPVEYIIFEMCDNTRGLHDYLRNIGFCAKFNLPSQTMFLTPTEHLSRFIGTILPETQDLSVTAMLFGQESRSVQFKAEEAPDNKKKKKQHPHT